MLIFVDKPSWYTSTDVVRKIKKLYPKAKVGHSGTLDPMASGLLIIWVGRDTKKLGEFQKLPKEYITVIDFSKETDSWDIDWHDWIKTYSIEVDKNGEKYILKDWKKIYQPTEEDIKKKLDSLIPEACLPVPPYSAKKIKWKRLYELARAWEYIQISRLMKIYEYDILEYNFPLLKLRLKVWGWTYIRSIWYWLWKQFNLWWVLVYLRRTAIWKYRL